MVEQCSVLHLKELSLSLVGYSVTHAAEVEQYLCNILEKATTKMTTTTKKRWTTAR